MWKNIRGFREKHLKNCSSYGKTCKNCNKPNQFARMCRSQQTNEVTEEASSSDEDCNLIRCFDSCDDFEIMSTEMDDMSVKQIEDYIANRLEKKIDRNTGCKESQNVKKSDIRRNPHTEQIKAQSFSQN